MSEIFIKIGSTRIKRSSIKSFGTSTEEREEAALTTSLRFALGLGYGIRAKIKGDEFIDTFKQIQSVGKYKRYLYITTYQNDDYKFYEDEVNIEQIIKQIEE